jgi:hypothetical protein
MESMLKNRIAHVLLLGLLVAGLVFFVKGPPAQRADVKQVAVPDAVVEHIKARWQGLWNRAPTEPELRGALGKFVREEILYREALARGLDREDPTVRLAMVMKMNALAASLAATTQPSEREVEAYFKLRQERYRAPARVSISQVCFSTDRRGEKARPDAEAALATLRRKEPSGDELARLGDHLMLRPAYVDQSAGDLDRVFGTGFGAKVAVLEPGRWHGPIQSGYGLHLVKVTERAESRLPELAEVRGKVTTDMLFEARRAAEDLFYQEIAAPYQVVYGAAAAEVFGGEGE